MEVALYNSNKEDFAMEYTLKEITKIGDEGCPRSVINGGREDPRF